MLAVGALAGGEVRAAVAGARQIRGAVNVFSVCAPLQGAIALFEISRQARARAIFRLGP